MRNKGLNHGNTSRYSQYRVDFLAGARADVRHANYDSGVDYLGLADPELKAPAL